MNPMPLLICIDKERRIAPKAIKPEKNSITSSSLDEANAFIHLYRQGVQIDDFLHHQFDAVYGERLQSLTVSLSMTKEFLLIPDGFHGTANSLDLTATMLKSSIHIDEH